MRTLITPIRFFSWFAICAFMTSPTFSDVPSADEQAQLDAILDDWQSRWERAQSVEYILEGRRMIPKGWISLTSQGLPLAPELIDQTIPSKDYWYPTRRRIVMDFEENRFRREFRGQRFKLEAGEFYNIFEIDMYDGKQLQSFRPREQNVLPDDPGNPYQAELFLQKDSSLGLSLERLDESLLTPHVRFPRYDSAPDVYDRLQKPLDDNAFHITGTALLDETECVVVRTETNAQIAPTFFEYWVDPAKESAILKIEHRLPEHVMQTHEIEYAPQHGSWYPTRIVLTEYLKDGRIEAREEITVVQMSLSPKLTDSLFHMDPDEGTIVYKEAEKNKYITQDGGELIDLSTSLSQERRREFLWWLFTGILGLGSLIGVVLYIRKSASKRNLNQ